jgi:hypothetical protein
MKPITQIEDAMVLPEREAYSINKVPVGDGIVQNTVSFRDLVAVDRDDNAILIFRDTDGRIMTINYDSNGAYKAPVT